ncbi:hypothetical protein MNBD_ALPHA04-2371 [hydrothermal vent metagenome]|uniref:Uncharacterized protein n=1 Tax=hydrothermal vent metagenome TaxID=652676 RepID=A0A3B0SYA9_9ZZZZ
MYEEKLQLYPLQKLILAYAKHKNRDRYTVLFAFDSRCGMIIRSTSETLIGQMRLTWWRDILTKPAEQRPDGEPLVALLNAVERRGSSVAPLLSILDGWEIVLDDFPWDARQFEQYAHRRGIGFFEFAIGPKKSLTANQSLIAKSWALWDFARNCSDRNMRTIAFDMCRAFYERAGGCSFDKSGRPLSILCKLVARDVKNGTISDDLYTPGVARKVIWHGLTGL